MVLLLALLTACRAERAPAPELVLDPLGLPDCARSYDATALCAAIEPWTSGFPEEFGEDDWAGTPIRWIGTEVEPSFCADDPAEAEAWMIARDPGVEGGTSRLDTSDDRWTDLLRYDAAGAATERQRVIRCAFLADLGPAPPGLASIPAWATYAAPPVADDDFFPVFREIVRWRAHALPVQVVLAHGEIRTETLHLGVCAARCGDCEDGGGGRYRNITGVLERIDVTVLPDEGVVDWAVEPLLETDCYARW